MVMPRTFDTCQEQEAGSEAARRQWVMCGGTKYNCGHEKT